MRTLVLAAMGALLAVPGAIASTASSTATTTTTTTTTTTITAAAATTATTTTATAWPLKRVPQTTTTAGKIILPLPAAKPGSDSMWCQQSVPLPDSCETLCPAGKVRCAEGQCALRTSKGCSCDYSCLDPLLPGAPTTAAATPTTPAAEIMCSDVKCEGSSCQEWADDHIDPVLDQGCQRCAQCVYEKCDWWVCSSEAYSYSYGYSYYADDAA